MARSRWRSTVVVATLAVAGLGLMPWTPAQAEVIRCHLTVRTVGDELRIIYRLKSPAAGRDYVVRFYLDGERIFQKRFTTDHDGRLRAVKRLDDPPGANDVEATGKDTVTGVVCATEVRVLQG